MKKTFKSYLGIWSTCLIVFNITAFIIPKDFTSNFLIGYVFITLAFIGQLLCANIAFKSENSQKFFYNYPLLSISYFGTLIMLVVGGLTMALAIIPYWIGIISCILVLALTAIAIINATVVSDTVSQIDKKVKVNTLFVKMLIFDSKYLILKANTDEAKTITKKVYETIRYSDPVSNDMLSSLEAQITVKFKEFENAVHENSSNICSIGEELIILIQNRNSKCKLLKSEAQ